MPLASLLFLQFQYELTSEKEDFRGLSALQIPHTVYGIRSAFICCPGSILLFPIWNFRIGTSELLPRTAKCTEFEEQISLENFAFVAISGHTVVSTFPRWLFTRHLRVCAGFQKVSTCQPCDQSKMYTGVSKLTYCKARPEAAPRPICTKAQRSQGNKGLQSSEKVDLVHRVQGIPRNRSRLLQLQQNPADREYAHLPQGPRKR